MFCEKCGKQINDNAAFCPYCGYTVGQPADSTESFVKDTIDAKKKRTLPIKKIIISLVAIIILAAASLGGVFLYYKNHVTIVDFGGYKITAPGYYDLKKWDGILEDDGFEFVNKFNKADRISISIGPTNGNYFDTVPLWKDEYNQAVSNGNAVNKGDFKGVYYPRETEDEYDSKLGASLMNDTDSIIILFYGMSDPLEVLKSIEITH